MSSKSTTGVASIDVVMTQQQYQNGVTNKSIEHIQQQQQPPSKEDYFYYNTNDAKKVPFLCRYWCYISNDFIPKYIVSYKLFHIYQYDITFTIVSAIVLGIVRYISEYFLLVYIFHWPYNTYITKNAAASVTGIIHSIQLVPSLYICFKSIPLLSTSSNSKYRSSSSNSSSSRCRITYNPSQHMSVVSDIWWKDTVDILLQFCTGYMIYDGILNCIYMKYTMVGTITHEDYLFLGHHIATILYMSSVRIIQQGHISAMICMLLGECTNPFHNLYYIAIAAQTLDCCNGILSTYLFHYITLLFAISYVLVRTIIGPVAIIHLTFNLWTMGRRKDLYPIPIALLVMWTILIWGVVLGSIPWIIECYHMIQKYYYDPTPLYQSTTSSPITLNDIIQPEEGLLTTLANGRTFDTEL